MEHVGGGVHRLVGYAADVYILGGNVRAVKKTIVALAVDSKRFE